jgi:uncharacterized protein
MANCAPHSFTFIYSQERHAHDRTHAPETARTAEAAARTAAASAAPPATAPSGLLPRLRQRVMPHCGLSLFGDERYLAAARPLLSSVEAAEWSVDSFAQDDVFDETAALLDDFAAKKRLIGHGVEYPLLSENAADLRRRWLENLKYETEARKYAGISVHFGFSAGWEFVEGAPLPVPLCDAALRTGKLAMANLSAVVDAPVGIENLALAFSKQDVADQGRFIDELLRDVDGYLLLDLHNIYCQSENFGVPMLEIIKTYPLKRVLEIHVAGGSWSEHGEHRIRRDTHDGRAPEAVFEALPDVLALCPNAQFVIFEKLPWSFQNEADAVGFREDYLRMKAQVTLAKAAA